MPELPEVETTVRGLRPIMVGKKISEIVVRQRNLRWIVPQNLAHILCGYEVICVERRAKYILIKFRHGTLLMHLGMSGRVKVVPHYVKPVKHDHIDFKLDSFLIIRYNDPRRFGCILWTSQDIHQHHLLSNLGPEPFDQNMNGKVLHTYSRSRSTTIKQFIMNSQMIVGVGNIYANEALFRAGLRPGRAASRVTLTEYSNLIESIRSVLREAIRAGGTTLKDFSKVNGEPGYFVQSLNVYNRLGKPCRYCRTVIKRKVIGQRASYYCPKCQC